ncbi:TPA: hypothetical protein J1246_001718 [Escherichia coli]|uniref:hypothetical protein n=1 Tax=Enterobacteriaceae TaxID=543 RepID=UPI0003C5D23D|nr:MULTISPECIES: hypothetical protein [Enterobacteriaceae]EAA7501305.1 hypothetical protein [Salmonella enterica subsp. enterica serovar Thompson]EAM9325602.1 hypothetical protein [Salmonella enterica]EBP3403694.1 hypothetical protein [Salmonella enterica subsp. enterica]ECU9585154.1 hypothetical protein [Salmonella enterica subsp. enterica serovar Gaminara]EIK6714472.1 hypothetical protein [Salmonella enterica subsp. enterica serovar Minnesota]
MNTEKIAFLFPYHKSENDEKSPMLIMETDELPVTTDLDFQVHFLGLIHDTPYWVSACLYRIENELEISVSGDKGVWIKAKGHNEIRNTLATSMSMHFDKCKLDADGDYLIRVSISKDNTLVHSAQAYFSVSHVKDA